jgi:hypothetical protein
MRKYTKVFAVVLFVLTLGWVVMMGIFSSGVAQVQLPSEQPNIIPEEYQLPGSNCLTPQLEAGQGLVAGDVAQSSYTPPQVVRPADPTNYGPRLTQDVHGRPLTNAWILVLHETVGSGSGAISYFQTRHPNDDDQRSYHAVILRNGTVVYLVPPQYRAFGAGNSVFKGPDGTETVQTNPRYPSSVNNFAYQISLESPYDGSGNGSTHSGYTSAQYRSLAWLTAQTRIPTSRITTHKAVDRSGTRKDPRSFNTQLYLSLLRNFSPTASTGCSSQHLG